MNGYFFLSLENKVTYQPMSEPDHLQQNHSIGEDKKIAAPEVIFDFPEDNYLTKIIKAELTPVLDIQRNEENHLDCILQCLGIAKYVQRGILPTGPIATGSVADEKVLKISTVVIPSVYNELEIKILNGGQFGELMNGRRPLQMESAKAAVLEKKLRLEAEKELTGFLHGLIYFGINNNYEMAHAIYFFATKQEVLYVDNQYSQFVSKNKYPFFDSVVENEVYDFEYFHKKLFIIKLGNWFFRWGNKVEFQELIKNIQKIYPQPAFLLDDNYFPFVSESENSFLEFTTNNEISPLENNNLNYYLSLDTHENFEKLFHNIEEQKIETNQIQVSGNKNKRKLNDKNYGLKIFEAPLSDSGSNRKRKTTSSDSFPSSP